MTNLSKKDFCIANPTQKSCLVYNILVLEAANYMGFMTSEFVNFMEIMAYYAGKDHCNTSSNPDVFPHRLSEKVSMPEIFDMISGSETGAIIASTLVVPNNDTATKDI